MGLEYFLVKNRISEDGTPTLVEYTPVDAETYEILKHYALGRRMLELEKTLKELEID